MSIYTMSDTNFSGLEEKVDELIQLCADMKSENQNLRDQVNSWEDERKILSDKNQLARVRLEKVLRRLKSLEQDD
jgi:cell division protein ZapB